MDEKRKRQLDLQISALLDQRWAELAADHQDIIRVTFQGAKPEDAELVRRALGFLSSLLFLRSAERGHDDPNF